MLQEYEELWLLVTFRLGQVFIEAEVETQRLRRYRQRLQPFIASL
jgi:hypothetical protein